MAKLYVPEQDYPKLKLQKAKTVSSSPWRDAWKRFRRNKLAMTGLILFLLLIFGAVFAPVLTPYDYKFQDYSLRLQAPSLAHLMGTDNYGRDIFTRVLYGARISLSISIISVGSSLILGGFLGAVAAYYSSIADNVIMRLMDIIQSIPSILLALAIAAALGPGTVNLLIAVSISSIPLFARVVRASVLTVNGKEYVEAARITGTPDLKIILKHMIPNSLGPIIVQATFNVAGRIQVIASLSYIGLGVQSPTPEWGAMLNAGKQFLTTDMHMVLFPGLMIILTTFALNVIGDGLRDALDPKLKR